ncbi:SIMPL domain-containing protein [Ferrovibrio sp.]|jgi:predicted secreted protein|uniref:SIMPL domain-containing protein n=1 Tax=Ferrovibrio sp. TaxID=1917215 RepID=UPI0035AFCD4D
MAPIRILSVAAVTALLLASGIAAAQNQRVLPDDATLLTLNEQAERDVAPDTIRARLVAQATSEQAAAAQSSVNAAMTKALARARALGLEVETGGYNTWQETPPRPQALPAGAKPPAPLWRAQQSLVLTAKEDAKLLEAVGILQSEGLALQELGYMISREQQRGIQDELVAEALQRLTARAQRAAAALGMDFAGWARIGVHGGGVSRPMLMRAAEAKGMAAGVPPVAAAGEQTVNMNVDGEAILKRR